MADQPGHPHRRRVARSRRRRVHVALCVSARRQYRRRQRALNECPTIHCASPGRCLPFARDVSLGEKVMVPSWPLPHSKKSLPQPPLSRACRLLLTGAHHRGNRTDAFQSSTTCQSSRFSSSEICSVRSRRIASSRCPSVTRARTVIMRASPRLARWCGHLFSSCNGKSEAGSSPEH